MAAVPKHSLSEPNLGGASLCLKADLVMLCSEGAQKVFQRLLPGFFIFYFLYQVGYSKILHLNVVQTL